MFVVKAEFNGILRRINIEPAPAASLASVWAGIKRATRLQHGVPENLAIKAVDVEGNAVENESDFQRLLSQAQSSGKASVKLIFSPDDTDTDTFIVVTDSQVQATKEPEIDSDSELEVCDDDERVPSPAPPEYIDLTTPTPEPPAEKPNMSLSVATSEGVLSESETSDAANEEKEQGSVSDNTNADSAMDTSFSSTTSSETESSLTTDTASSFTDPSLSGSSITENRAASVISGTTSTVPQDAPPQYMDASTSPEAPAAPETETSATSSTTSAATFEEFMEEVQPLVDQLLAKFESRPEYLPRLLDHFGPMLSSRNWGLTITTSDDVPIASTMPSFSTNVPPPPAPSEPEPSQAAATRPATSGSTAAVSTHRWHRVCCDACGVSAWTGFRYKCNDCSDFDLCEWCFNERSVAAHGKNHTFHRCAGPDDLWSGVTCDNCEKRSITGARYKCRHCLDYDLCESCFKRARSVHPWHAFTKMEKVDSQTIRSTPITHADVEEERKREQHLKTLWDMGFEEEELNKMLLVQFDGDLEKAVEALARMSV